MEPRYALCRGGAHDNERWPLSRQAFPGDTFDWDEPRPGGPQTAYALVSEIIITNLGPMWVAMPTAA